MLEESGCWHRASANGKVGDSVAAPGAWHNTHWVQATGNRYHWAILTVTFCHCILILYYKLLYVTIVLMFFTFKSAIHLWDPQTHSHILRVQSTFMTSWQWRWTSPGGALELLWYPKNIAEQLGWIAASARPSYNPAVWQHRFFFRIIWCFISFTCCCKKKGHLNHLQSHLYHA